MRKYDKSLIEVWEWKERVYSEFKNLTTKEYLKRLKDDADKILSERHIKLSGYIHNSGNPNW